VEHTQYRGKLIESVFSGLPAGDRGDVGNFNDVRDYGMWWAPMDSWAMGISATRTPSMPNSQRPNNFQINGKSVRCVKD